jgi:hypothetical protein
MISGQILNSDASLNNFIVLDSKAFIPGEQFDIVFRLINQDLELRYIPPATATIKVVFNTSSGVDLEINASYVDVLDRSLVKLTISEAQSEDLIGGNFSFEIDVLGDGTEIKKGFAQNALAKTLIGGC